MLKTKLTCGLSTLLLGMSLAAPAGAATCNSERPTCGQNGTNPDAPVRSDSPAQNNTPAPVVSYDSSFYGFTVGVYGAINLPFHSSDVTDMSIEPALPAGLQFNTATGGITGTPTTPTQGVPAFVIRAVNSSGHSGSTVIRIAVNPARVAPEPSPSPSPSMTPEPTASPLPTPDASVSPTPAMSPTPTVSPTPQEQQTQSGEGRQGNGLFARLIEKLRAQNARSAARKP